jgi:hypothetical protein
MRIKRFFENEVQGPEGKSDLNDISPDKVNQIIDGITSAISTFEEKLEVLKKSQNDLTKFKSNSKDSNDQIDDSVVSLGDVTDSIQKKVIDELDSIKSKLEDYIKEGRQFLYNA